MSKRKIVTLSILAALVIAVAFGAVAYGSARAAGVIANTGSVVADLAGRGGRGHEGITDEDVAAALGISVDELAAARDEAKSAMLEQAVADDLITQAQADDILAGDSSSLPRVQWRIYLSENGLDYDTYLAEALGISVEELQAARLEAFTTKINQAVADGSITQERADLILGRLALTKDSTFQSAMQSAFEAAVNQAVDSGVITQAQADQILANSSGIWMGRLGGRGHGHHAGDFEVPASPETSTTTP